MVLEKLIRWTYRPRHYIAKLGYSLSSHAGRIERMKDLYAGKPMLVVGNGPSLNQTPLEKFSGVPAIGMNKIDLLFERTTWRPSLILTVNSMVVKQHAERFSQLEVPVFVSWKARWLIPRRFRNRIGYFCERANCRFSFDVADGVGSLATVTYAALQFAHYMGANPVVLFGVDHSYGKVSTTYSYEPRVGPDNDHFDPNYFAAGSYWGIPNLDDSDHAYRMSRAAFEESGRKIYDATIGGKLDVFEKISLDHALQLCGR